MNDKRLLLCTFSTPVLFKKTIDDIKKFYRINACKFFVFSNTKNENETFITYNVDTTSDKKFENTISIHRKKHTNTLYTLNAMNKIIEDENNGVFDNKFLVNWELYKNCLIITNEISIRVISIKILDVINC